MTGRMRQLASDTLVYGISSVVARFVNYLLVPLHTDRFDPDQYVVVGLVYAAIALLNVLFTAGFESAYVRFSKSREGVPVLFATSQTFLLLLATGLCGLLVFVRPASLPLLELGDDPAGIFWMMLGILWFDTLVVAPFAEFRMARRTWRFAALKLFHVAVNVGLNLALLLGAGMGVEAVFVSNLAASALTAFLAWGSTWSLLKGGRFDLEVLRKAWAFGWPFIPAGLGHAVNELLDRFFLAGMDPADAARLYGEGTEAAAVAGIYNGVYKMAVFMLLLVQMFRMAWQPFFMRHADEPNAPALFERAFNGFNLVAGAVFLLVGLFLHEIASLTVPLLGVPLLGEAYRSGLSVVPILLAAYWFHGWYIHFSAGVYINGNSSAFAWITLAGALITVISNWLLVPLFGMAGAALTTLFSYLTMALILLAVSRRSWPVPYRVIPSLTFVGALFAGVWFEPRLAELLVGLGWLESAGDWDWKLAYAGGWLLLLAAGALWWKQMGRSEGERAGDGGVAGSEGVDESEEEWEDGEEDWEDGESDTNEPGPRDGR